MDDCCDLSFDDQNLKDIPSDQHSDDTISVPDDNCDPLNLTERIQHQIQDLKESVQIEPNSC